MKKATLSLIVIALALYFITRKGSDTLPEFLQGESVFSINGVEYTAPQLRLFSEMKNYYPIHFDGAVFPGRQAKNETAFIEMELFSSNARRSSSRLFSGVEWDLMDTYLRGQVYAREILGLRRGATDDELQQFFDDERHLFLQGEDGSIPRDFQTFRDEVTDSFFVRNIPPTERFIAANPGLTQSALALRWLEEHTRNYFEFFLSYLYEEKYGFPFVFEYDAFVGEGKPVSEEEIDIVIGWLPRERREMIKTEQQRLNYGRFVLGWKLFADRADQHGFTATDEFKYKMELYRRYHAVSHYLNNVFYDGLEPAFNISTEHLKYALWDRTSNPLQPLDSAKVEEFRKERVKVLVDLAYRQRVNSVRNSSNVIFLDDFARDSYAVSAAALFRRADSLRSIGNVPQSRVVFQDVVNSYGFTDEGSRAILELARIATSQRNFREAIRNYREYILRHNDIEDLANAYFMIAYIYGENLRDYEQAAANYQWILKYAPTSAMADDAEFMLLHLGEPMPDIDELRDRAYRQGKSFK